MNSVLITCRVSTEAGIVWCQNTDTQSVLDTGLHTLGWISWK